MNTYKTYNNLIYITCIVFCFFYSVCFGSTPRLLSTLESKFTLPCCNLLNQSPFTLARSLLFPTLLNGQAQPHNLMADRPCREFTFYIYCWDFWQMRSSSYVFIENLVYSVLCLKLWSLSPEAIRVSIRGLVSSFNWTMSLKLLRLRIAHEEVGSRGECVSHSRQRVPGAREWRSGRNKWDVKGIRLSGIIQLDGGCYCSADKSVIPWKICHSLRALLSVFSLYKPRAGSWVRQAPPLPPNLLQIRWLG